MKRISLVMAFVGALATAGCTTAMQDACLHGEGYNGMSAEATCNAAAIQTQQQNQIAMAAVGVLAAGALGVGVYAATRPTYVYTPPTQVYVYRGW